MEFNIQQIKLILDLNVPDMEPVLFTREMIYHPTITENFTGKKYATYPFITDSFIYPKSELKRFNSLDSIIKFYFNKTVYTRTMQNYKKTHIINNKENEKIIDVNVRNMIEIFFSTVFPIPNNYSNSYENYILQNPISFSFKGSMPNFLGSISPGLNNNFSYIKIKEKIYTITKTIWRNDIFNHPKYRLFIENLHDFKMWKNNIGKKIKEDNEKKSSQLITVIKNVFTSDNLDKYTQLLKNKKTNTAKYNTQGELINKYYDELIEMIAKIHILIIGSDNDEIIKYVNSFKVEILKNIRYVPRELINDTKSFFSSLTGISNDIYISEKYFNGNLISKNIEKEPDDITQQFNTKYKKYSDFINLINEYIKPNRECSGRELNNMITDFANGIDSKLIEVIDDNAYEIYINLMDNNESMSKEEMKSLYVGVNYFDSPVDNITYEAYIYLDVIGGEITNSNISSIKCDYKGEYLVDLFNNMKNIRGINKYLLSEDRFFLNVKDLPSQKINNVNVKENKIIGGNKTLRKKTTHKQKYIHTRRNISEKRNKSHYTNNISRYL